MVGKVSYLAGQLCGLSHTERVKEGYWAAAFCNTCRNTCESANYRETCPMFNPAWEMELLAETLLKADQEILGIYPAFVGRE